MKKITALAIMAVTWYFAGVYRQKPMMVMLVMEIAIIIIMLFLTYFLKRKVFIKFKKTTQSVKKNSETLCSIEVNNKNKLPVNRLGTKMHFNYFGDKKTLIKKNLYGGVDSKKRDTLEFGISAPYCGIIKANINKLIVYDYFSMFSSSKKTKESMDIVVLPVEKPMKIQISTSSQYAGDNNSNIFFEKNNDDCHEIKQIREYRDSDSNRFIHWNYSAKTEELWVKEYEQENGFRFGIFLDTSYNSTNKSIKAEELDAFYETTSSIILGLLENNVIVTVYWYDNKHKSIKNAYVTSSEECMHMLSDFYNSEVVYSVDEKFIQLMSSTDFQMKINLNLEWYFNNRSIYTFSKTMFNEEISQKVFIL